MTDDDRLRCPACGEDVAVDVLCLPDLPVAINAQVSPVAALDVPRGDIDLVACGHCSHLYNRSFDLARLGYDASYENSLHFSPRFQAHAAALAARLVDDHDLAGGAVAEAGSGPGHFLALLCEAGVSRASGFDPSYDPDRLGAPQHPAVSLSSAPYPVDGSLTVRLALSQHVMEHLADPVALLAALGASVAADPEGVVYTEVPNGELMVDRCALWDLIYEHVSYFTPTSLGVALGRAGLSVGPTTVMFDDQFLAIESKPVGGAGQGPDPERVAGLVDRAVGFGKEARERIALASAELERRSARGPVALWGAGSKGMTYLNLVAPDGGVSAVVDLNPRKWGRGVPGVSNEIVAPQTLTALQPATVLIANPIYRDEIDADLRELGVEAELLPLWD